MATGKKFWRALPTLIQPPGAEALKNSMFSGTALMYLVGTDAIHQLRKQTAAREGVAFDLKHFHDRFRYCGSVPRCAHRTGHVGRERRDYTQGTNRRASLNLRIIG
jgi:hypothetical protein